MNKQNINQEQPTFATAPPASTNNIQAQTQPPIRTWDIYENNPQEKLIGYYGWFLKMGEESKRFMEDMHARTLDLYETEGIRGLSRYISDFTWNQMEYSYDRWDEKTGRPTNKYNSIYKDGYPEAIDVLCQGQSVCLEKAYFTAEFINTHPTASQEWVAVPLLVTVTTHYTNNAIHLSPHKFVGLYDKASYINPEVSTPSYFVDYGQVAPADFVLDNHHPLKDGTGYVEYSNPRFSLTEPGSTPYFENK